MDDLRMVAFWTFLGKGFPLFCFYSLVSIFAQKKKTRFKEKKREISEKATQRLPSFT